MIGDSFSTVAFTGHRTYCGQADDTLRRAVGAAYARGCRTFLSGMAVGFDLAAAEAVLECRAVCPGLRLVAVIPFKGHIQFCQLNRTTESHAKQLTLN